MTNYVNNKIEEMNGLISQLKVAANGGCGRAEYEKIRLQINSVAIEAACGGEIKPARSKKGGNEVKILLTKKAPSQVQVAEIVGLMEELCYSIEAPYMSSVNEDEETSDLEIPDTTSCSIIDTVSPEKMKKKEMEDLLFGSDGLLYRPISGREIIELAAIADEYRKKRNRVIAISVAVGGTAILVGTAITLGVIAANKKKESFEDETPVEGDITADDVPADIDEDDVPCDDVSEDVPEVELE